LQLKAKDTGKLQTIEPQRMTIDYIGATGSFAAQTSSFSDVLENQISPERFRGKYVLIGATAATLGDKIATPFVHQESSSGNQHGELMPGVEILANSVNTILRGRFYGNFSDWTAALCAALTAFAVLFLTGFARGKFEAAKQICSLACLAGLILFVSYLVYFYVLIIPPVVPMFVSLAAAAPLALLKRSLTASRAIDERISELLALENNLLVNGREGILKSGETQNYKNPRIFPRSLEWKTQTLGFLSSDLIASSLFVDRALRSLEEGLLIADANGSISFANERAAEILGVSERRLIGSALFARISEAENTSENPTHSHKELIDRLLIDQTSIRREIIIGNSPLSHYVLRLSPVVSQNKANAALGIVATLADVTQHHELQQIKNDVITLVTHELRTPMTAIQGMSEILTEHDDIEPEARRKMLATINIESKRLARMINEYLDITRIESGIQKARFGSTDIINLLEQTLLLVEPQAARREIIFERRFATDSTVIFADAGMMAQALTNIVGNAVKYTADKTTITVEVQISAEQLKISVTDEGFGISAEQLPHIFEKFYRVPHRRTADIPGTGLGLALTREVIELHGGRITVESELNIGSIFTVYLPLAPKS
jgi:PAS domain S-box-containing protein